MQKLILVIGLLFSFFLFSCRKDKISSDSSLKLSFSVDTVLFDTVFTTVGSVTKQLRVYNPNKDAVKISKIKVAGGATSQFRINVDGIPTYSTGGIEVEGRDSIYIFVEVTVDPTNSNSPLVVSDSILFETNGNIQDVKLVAWGQDAHYFYPNRVIPGLPPFSIIGQSGTQVHWVDDKPYVIYGYAVVDSASTLTIDPGVRVHLHKNSGLWVYRGATIKAKGTKEKPITFQGARLDQEYKDIAGQWDRIWINEGSVNNEIDYAVIKNGFIGIQAETIDFTSPLQSNLKISNTVIQNMTGMGIFTRFYYIRGYNNVISNCGKYNLAITYGGGYNFTNCTFANYWKGDARKTPLMLVNSESNFPLDSAYFGNCIIHGDLKVEGKDVPELKVENNSTATFNYKFEYCLIKTTEDLSANPNFASIYKNEDPGFEGPGTYKFNLRSDAFSIDKGSAAVKGYMPFDIEGKPRTAVPDLGAWEY